MILNVRDADQKTYWERHAHGRKWDHPVTSFFVRQRLSFLDRFIRWENLHTLLDVGCGYGNTLTYCREKVGLRVGVDRSFAMLSGCPKEAGFLVQAPVTQLPFKDNSFDCLFGWEILHHLESPEKAVQEFVRVARRYVVLFEPNRYNPAQFLFGLLDRSERGTLHFSKQKVEALLRQSGLTVLFSATVGATFPNRMPTFLLPLVQKCPFHLPWIGISSMAIGGK
ncbi:MAG: methyltransferase domain-containing protein [Candidatus Omnitrophica bacterium]|nr:methyltransferase domain-containing protein [Candidatus Omnitrophota bacterium]